jgi:hypothetical protein
MEAAGLAQEIRLPINNSRERKFNEKIIHSIPFVLRRIGNRLRADQPLDWNLGERADDGHS